MRPPETSRIVWKRQTPTPETLAARVGCAVDDLVGLLAAMPPSPANALRREVLVRHYFGGESLAALAARDGVTPQRVSERARRGIDILRLLRRGEIALPTRIRTALGLGSGAVTIAEAVRTTDCARLLRRANVGVTSVRQLHDYLARCELTLACRCPRRACAAWLRVSR